MTKLAPMLERLSRHDEAALRAGEAAAKLVIASGRRGRIEGDGDFETVSNQALSEDEVRDLLAQTGGGTRVDRLNDKSTGWSFRHEGINYWVDALIDGRELRATIRRAKGDEATPRTPRPQTSNDEARVAVREEFAPRKKDPRADESQTLGQVREERTATRAKTLDPRADEEPAAPPKERRRDSKARRTTPRAMGRSGSKRDIPKSADQPASSDERSTPSTDRRGDAPIPKGAERDVEAWSKVVGGSGASPLFTLEAPDADVRELKIDPDDDQRLPPPLSAEERAARAVTARGHGPQQREPLPAVFGIELQDVRPQPASSRVPTNREGFTTRPATNTAPTKPEPFGDDETSFARDPKPIEVEAKLPKVEHKPERPTTRDQAPPIELEAKVPAPIARAEAPPAPREKVEAPIALAPRSPIDTAFALDAALEKLVEQARAGGASDLHIVAGRPAIARIAGALVPAGAPIPRETVEAMLLASIPPQRRATFDRDGATSFASVVGSSARCRVAVSRQRTGFKASIRLLPPEPQSLSELELPDALDQALRHHQGLIVISGPSGQGKTTTLAAMVDHINTNTTGHVLTVEDPIEYVHSRKKAMMSQREVGTHTLSFANALRSSLRQDPDVIVIGELRDVETVRTALSASETGHLVLGTINTPSAPKTIDRLIDLFPPPEQPQVRATLAAALRLIASQRLLPRREGGGRVAAVEILPGSLALSNLIRDNRTFQIPSLMQRGRGSGVVRLDDELLELVRRGVVDRKDAIAAADDPTELQSQLEGRGAGGDGKGGRPVTGEAAGAVPPRPAAAAPSSDEGEGRGGKALWKRAADMFRRGGT